MPSRSWLASNPWSARRRTPATPRRHPAERRLTAGLWCTRVVDEVAELVAPGDAELGVGAVQVRGDGAGGQEQSVGDLAVGQATSGEDDDVALLGGEPV